MNIEVLPSYPLANSFVTHFLPPDCVTAQVNKSVPKKDVEDFPTTIAVNAFRGYLDEYQKKRLRRPPAKRKAPKTKQPKDQKKKPTKEVIICLVFFLESKTLPRQAVFSLLP